MSPLLSYITSHAQRAAVACVLVLTFTACSDRETPLAPIAGDARAIRARDTSSVSTPTVGEKPSTRYVVVLRDSAPDQIDRMATEQASRYSGRVTHVFHHALHGYSVQLNSPTDAQMLARDPQVALVEADHRFSITTTQSSATWGLDRLDQHELPLSKTFAYTATASNVTAYIIDTGIRSAHKQFGTRASLGFNALPLAAPNGDCNGHGTHVAGTIGGTTYGVAKGVKLVAVRVLDCDGSGTTTDIITGIDFVIAQKRAKPMVPMVANMSLGGEISSALDAAVESLISSGVIVVVAAGNSNDDACYESPARVAGALTVAATTNRDARAAYSNYGHCVDLFAPGSSIMSAWFSSNSATKTLSGTSMAAPHAAGVAALYLSAHPTAAVSVVVKALVAGATSGKLTSTGPGSPNALLFSSYRSATLLTARRNVGCRTVRSDADETGRRRVATFHRKRG